MGNFSVLMSVYIKDDPAFLRQALDSVIKYQTILPNEIILVKDGPLTKELEQVIGESVQQYPSIFKILQNDKNIGLGLSLAKGLLECTNEYVARMDADDISKSDRFEKQLKEINEGYDLVSSWSEFFEDDVNNVIAIKKRPEFHSDIVKLSKRRSPVCHACSMFRKSAVLAAGNYKHCLYYEDYYLWLRMIHNGAKFYNIQGFIYSIRTSNNQFGRRGGWNYLDLELKHIHQFYKEGYYSKKDYFYNSIIRIFTRILPLKIRRNLYLFMWKLFN